MNDKLEANQPGAKMNTKRYGIWMCLMLVLGATACTASRSPMGGGSAGGAFPDSANLAQHSLPELDVVVRQHADAETAFLIQQKGSDFGADIAVNRCSPNGDTADFTPQWSAAGPNPAGRAAFAIYRLSYDPQTQPVTLSLAWNGPAPADADCWIGLSDWAGQVWRWQQPVAGQLVLDHPEQYVDSQQHCYVAVLLLGVTPCTLATIGFGIPAPPTPNGDGYTLFSPLLDRKTYLLDMQGNVVRQWESQYGPGATAELMENGHVLRASNLNNTKFPLGGRGGGIEEYNWEGYRIWHYELNTDTECTHHDFTRLPNGNILLLVTDSVTQETVTAAGRNPATLNGANFWVDAVYEIQPTQPNDANIVWEWHAMDHLVQNFNAADANYGDPAAHPELLNLNYPPSTIAGDWTHCNCVAYNPDLDQIMLTSLYFSEIWVIDHSTTTAEAATHAGGQSGRGGDLLYRWGNPQAYSSGALADQQFYGCHNGHWIADGLEGAGDVLVFRNQTDNQDYSSVVQLTLPLNPDGSYTMTGGVYGPDAPHWTFEANPTTEFYSEYLGSAQRLPGGETFVDSGQPGNFFVIDAAGEVKWQYHNALPIGPTSPVFRALRYTPDYPGLANLVQP